MLFGILREFIILALLGFSARNDTLQLYLSIFYTISLSLDAMRLACLNLYSILSLPRLLFAASLIGLPFAISIGTIMSYATGGLNFSLLSITIGGSYLNLIAVLLITYKQRNNRFLSAQIINILPNFILIPGILLCYYLNHKYLVPSIIILTTTIPILQCSLLLLLKPGAENPLAPQGLSLFASVKIFARHFAAMISEQLFQIITRSAFYNYATGFLSMYAIILRIYSAARFILIDSFIGAKLANWEKNWQEDDTLEKLLNFTLLSLCIASIAFLISLKESHQLIQAGLQISAILICGFYFSTLVRILYFKINRHENNPSLVIRFALCELLCVFVALGLTRQLHYPLLYLLWIGYIAKPFIQLHLLRKHYRLIYKESM
jgi:hypothetical protein